MSTTLKILLGLGLLGGAAVGALFLFVLVEGPRMKVQPNVRAYQRVAPLPPPATVPASPAPYPPARVTASSPLPPATPENLARGKAYYELYCLFCHGADGKGHGPVGEAFHPAPADLTADSVRAKPAAGIHVGMLTGEGHSPVLEKAVPAAHRGPLLLYVTSLRR